MAVTDLKKSGSKRLSPEDWLRAGLDLLGETGDPKSVKIEPLCTRLGVTKGSFYWHFKGRADLMNAMVGFWARDYQTLVHEGLGALPEDDPVEFFQQLTAFWGEGSFAAIDTAMRRWAIADDRVAAAIASADRFVQDRLIKMYQKLGFDEAQARHRSLLVIAIGIAAPQMAHLIAEQNVGAQQRGLQKLLLDL